MPHAQQGLGAGSTGSWDRCATDDLESGSRPWPFLGGEGGVAFETRGTTMPASKPPSGE